MFRLVVHLSLTMTVSSLWKALNKGECGKPVGGAELVSGQTKSALWNVKPWTLASGAATTNKTQVLAVDLSIWICESLTSQRMTEQNVNPALHLVFSRTVKLLGLGIKLIVVIEGKSRVRAQMGDDDRFRKRRSGTAFWKACHDCQKMLELLGVPVVRAKAEGEALCALLSHRGIVDGVISNDGDCLLFGAKVIYTKFSIENLENSCVMRYDLDNLRAIAEKSDDKEAEEYSPAVLLSRQDLIAFALLTGSDLAGSGLAKVGHKKAIRFIRKCKQDNPLSTSTAALDEMQAWARAASAEGVSVEPVDGDEDDENKKTSTCCSRCCHIGSKRNHQKNGCELCGTEPDEACFKVTSEDRFRKSLRSKALAMSPKFEPSKVLHAYLSPNENQIPFQLANASAASIQMSTPQLSALMQMNLIVKGRDLGTSRAFLQQAVGRLLSRAELLRPSGPSTLGPSNATRLLPRDRPVPKLIQKALVQRGVPCFEVLWCVNATVTDNDGEGIDGYEYVTVELRQAIERCYPDLVSSFQEAEKERKQQGDGEKIRRQEFLASFLFAGKNDGGNTKRLAALAKARQGFFQKNKVPQWRQGYLGRSPKRQMASDDVANLLRFISVPVKSSPVKRDGSVLRSLQNDKRCPLYQENLFCSSPPKKRLRFRDEEDLPSLTPSKDIFCNMGDVLVPLTPIDSNQGAFPPRYIYLHNKRASKHS